MTLRLPHAHVLGIVGGLLIAAGSFGGGAIRSRGGLLHALGLDFLAYGHGSAWSTTWLWIGIVLFVGAWLLHGRQVIFTPLPAAQRAQHTWRTIWWWVATLIPAAPIMSRDVYSYLMQGAMVRDGFDPYSQGAAVNPGPMLLEVSRDWRNTTTPYGPLHLWIGKVITTLVGDNVTAGVALYKVVSVAGFAAIAWAVVRIARRLGADEAKALWLGVANPVMIFHLVGGMHNESLMVGLVSLGLVACLHKRFVLGVALISVAVSLKATAAIALPFVVWMATHHYGKRSSWLAFFITGFIGAVETIGVVAAVTWASGSSWGWLSEISGNSKVINPLSAPSLLAGVISPYIRLFNPDFGYNSALTVLRPAFMVLMLLSLVATWWIYRHDTQRAITGIVVAYAVTFTFNSVTLPWYYASIISLLGVLALSTRALRIAVAVSCVIALAFTGSGNHSLYNLFWVGGSAVLGFLGAWWATSALDAPKTPSPAPGA